LAEKRLALTQATYGKLPGSGNDLATFVTCNVDHLIGTGVTLTPGTYDIAGVEVPSGRDDVLERVAAAEF